MHYDIKIADREIRVIFQQGCSFAEVFSMLEPIHQSAKFSEKMKKIYDYLEIVFVNNRDITYYSSIGEYIKLPNHIENGNTYVKTV